MYDYQLLQAKYKNIPFFVRKESIDQLGQKRIIHDYPSSGTRYVEAQGLVPNEFSIDIFFSGLLWKDYFELFKSVLELASPGRLVLPVFGVIENVVAMPTSASSSMTDIGIITMTVKFSVTVEKPSPTSIVSSQSVSASANAAVAGLGAGF